jgi:hypothetical protein
MWVQEGKEAGQSTTYAIFFLRQEDGIMWVQVGKKAGQSTASAIFFLRQEDRIMWVQVGKEDGQPAASGYSTLETGGQDHVGSGRKEGWTVYSLRIFYS